MFSPSLPTSSARSSSSSEAAFGPCFSTASRTRWAKTMNSALFETGSVSQPTATMAPTFPVEMSKTTLPSVVSRPAFFAAWARPFSRMSLIASSMSPPVSTRARLQSIIPAPGALAELLDQARPEIVGHDRTSSASVSASASGSAARASARQPRARRAARPRRRPRSRRLPRSGPSLGLAPAPACGAARASRSGARAPAPSPSACRPRCRRRSRGRSASTSGSRRRCPGSRRSPRPGRSSCRRAPMTGTPSRCASRTASCSLRRSMMKTASG